MLSESVTFFLIVAVVALAICFGYYVGQASAYQRMFKIISDCAKTNGADIHE